MLDLRQNLGGEQRELAALVSREIRSKTALSIDAYGQRWSPVG